MERVLITGTSRGVGRATALKFIEEGYEVVGFDILESTIDLHNYQHCIVDVRNPDTFPELLPFDIVVNNAGTPYDEEAIEVNLLGYINIAKKYADQNNLKSLVNVGSISGRVGIDGTYYCASQGGRISLTKHWAIEYGNKYGASVNCVSLGAVLSGLEPYLYERPDLLQKVADQKLIKRWLSCEESAEWIYFVATKGRGMTGQDILVDCGEEANYEWIHV